ncbi:MAG: 4-hydroxy-3-methylbut-2-enyl diphosphate reductase [Bacteroidetes bacterium HGW-Bacteroidetes-17]|jgi:4-hydroxy-3-methylbut-2-enyl diphosphate reductase|nr:MAG: 4-hydroxy-3-methylbut-2-enyl diphosphate reductase [Bacteroidetes bacterium HGW-Bacteroidetes-17]
MQVFVDPNSGFCGGVVKAVKTAEKEIAGQDQLYCLGEIVHNQAEVARLTERGIIFISHDDLKSIRNAKVLVRAHGEPPETYQLAKQNNIELIDATCKVVQRLQRKVGKAAEEIKKVNGQIVIFGKTKHPEVLGLMGQSCVEVVILEKEGDIRKIDFTRPIRLFSQTTMSMLKFEEIKLLIQSKLNESQRNDKYFFEATNSVCKQVSKREEKLVFFARSHDVIVFVGGQNSSNAKFLFGICKEHNAKSYFVANETEIQKSWFEGADLVGVSGATSTPQWLMNEVAEKIKTL